MIFNGVWSSSVMKLVSSVFNLQASYILGIITGFNNWFVGLYGLYVSDDD